MVAFSVHPLSAGMASVWPILVLARQINLGTLDGVARGRCVGVCGTDDTGNDEGRMGGERCVFVLPFENVFLAEFRGCLCASNGATD